jgi:hypothetical protein
MNISKEEFNDNFQKAIDLLLEEMADNPEVDIERFYSMTCLLENVAIFSPVIYGVLQNSRSKKKK